MKTLFPAFCGALLLASSLPAAAHQKANDFGGNQFGAASHSGRIGTSMVAAERSARQLPGRSGSAEAGRIPGILSGVKANAGRSFAESRTGGASGELMDWGAKRPSTRTYWHPQR